MPRRVDERRSSRSLQMERHEAGYNQLELIDCSKSDRFARILLSRTPFDLVVVPVMTS